MNRIKDVLEEKGIKQKWLAEKLGKSFNSVNSYVQNRQQPRLEILNEIALILDVDIRELIVSTKMDSLFNYINSQSRNKIVFINKMFRHRVNRCGKELSQR